MLGGKALDVAKQPLNDQLLIGFEDVILVDGVVHIVVSIDGEQVDTVAARPSRSLRTVLPTIELPSDIL